MTPVFQKEVVRYREIDYQRVRLDPAGCSESAPAWVVLGRSGRIVVQNPVILLLLFQDCVG